jgi:hypothetical protein
MNSLFRAASLVIALLALFANPLRADWINLTGAETAPNIAEITVLDDRVRVALEVYVGNIEVFEALLPDDWFKRADAARPPYGERLKDFSDNIFQVVTEDGVRLRAQAKLVEARLRKDRFSPFAGMLNPITRQRVPEPPRDKRVVYAELEYPFESRPTSLTFVPPSDARGVAAVTVGFITYHKSVPVIDFRYLSGPATLHLNWADPWYSKFDNINLTRHHRDALMSFLYVEPREVRHEVIARVRDLQQWTDLGLKGGATIDPAEQGRLKQRVQAFFERRNPLEIDGTRHEPAASRVEFLEISLRGVQVIEEELKPLDLSTAILGVILSYPVKHLPNKVTVDWELFTPRIERVPTTATDPAGSLKGYIDKEAPTIEWENFLRKYVEPNVTPVVLDDGRAFAVPALSAALVLAALIAAGLSLRARAAPRYAWAAGTLLCVLAAVPLHRTAVVDLPNPVPGVPTEPAAAKIVAAVLDNVNIAYLERGAPALRPALGNVVAEAAYAEVELELSRALAVKVAGGGIARVKAIENLAVKEIAPLDGRPGFRTVAEWEALASADHWGHAHRRKLRFRALMELAEIDGGWKLTGLTVVDARQEG